MHKEEIKHWTKELREAIRDVTMLLESVGLSSEQIGYSAQTLKNFPIRITHSFLKRIEKNNPNDPLLRQIFPLKEESYQHPEFNTDPLLESSQQIIPGLLHKYHGRVLLITTAACAIHCRYCFRKHFPYPKGDTSRSRWGKTLQYLTEHTELTEIILSGGDPLILSDQILSDLLKQLTDITHLKRLRIHTRIPTVLPTRITEQFVYILSSCRFNTVIVIHTNHANELSEETACALAKLSKQNILLLNQSVLLRGVNDNAKSLINLSEKLFEQGVLPYYLHLLDQVTGTQHYKVVQQKARMIMTELRTKLPGYLVPKLVSEQAGRPYKEPIF